MVCQDCIGKFCFIDCETGDIICWNQTDMNGNVIEFKDFESMNNWSKKHCEEPEASDDENK